MDRSEKVEAYYATEDQFKEAIARLRELAIKTGMDETFKWSFPTYTLNSKNVVAICRFKNHFGIWFYKGVFLSDPDKVLENAQEGKTQAMRHWKFKAIAEIDDMKVLSYMKEALENERKGLAIIPKKKLPIKVVIPELLKNAFENKSELRQAFKNLSPSKQKEYTEYIRDAKQLKTKNSRIDKILPMIAQGKGLNDLYRK